MSVAADSTWPVLRSYTGENLRRVAMPLGGIGTGTVSLGGRGDLRDWEIMNRPAKGFTPPRGFFALRIQERAAEPRLLALEGPLDPVDYEGAHGMQVPGHGLPRFRSAVFHAAYPLAQVELSDPDVPVRVRLEAFNPLVPTDPEASGIPAAVLRYVIENPTDEPVQVTVCGNLPNIVGTDGSEGAAARNRNEIRREQGLVGILGTSDGVDPAAEQWGSLALSTTDVGDGISTRTAWADLNWGDSLLDFWDDLIEDGRLDERVSAADDPTGSLAVTRTVPAGAAVAVTFHLTWHFPNRTAWGAPAATGGGCCAPETGCCGADGNTVGNHYTTCWADAWQVATDLAARTGDLENATVDFVRTLLSTEAPEEMLEAALFNLSTLRSQTAFRTADGRFFGWEGCSDTRGCCDGSCTHVWNYEPATAHLFGSLARSLRDTEFAWATDDRGLMSFRIHLPLQTDARGWGYAAADGQMGCLVKLYRDWRLSGDEEMLRTLWPHARRALEFCWIPGGWDADRDGVMEGCQHNTYDVEFYGPNPQMGGWYLAALRAAEEMARHLGEDGFAETCRDLFTRGSAWIEANLFTGEYYRQQIRPVASAEAIAPGLRHHEGAKDLSDPELQLGDACLTDQLVGQSTARLCGLGDLLDADHVRTTLRSIVRYNHRSDLHGHVNHMRTYALADEPGLLVSSYPHGNRPRRPFPYFSEVWPGLEYTAAVGLIQAGEHDAARAVVRDVRSRFDGRRRNPFNEAECGNHYARSLAAWGLLLAWSGFGYDAETGVLRLRGTGSGRDFWSTGQAWGTCDQGREGDDVTVHLQVHGGTLHLREVRLGGLGTFRPDSAIMIGAGQGHTFTGSAEIGL